MHLRSRALPIAALIVAVAIGAAMATGAMRDDDSGARAAETDATRTVNVTGVGRVALTPDTVTMTLGVDIVDPDLGTAQARAAETMEAVLAALRATGVADDDIQTSTYGIYVDRDYNRPNQPIVGFHVTHLVTAKVRDIDRAGETISAAVDAGANTIGGVWFSLEDPAGAIAQARELAMADARAKAADLARLADSTLGPVLTLTESSSGGVPVPYADGKGEQPAADVQISPGQTEVSVNVTVTYALN